MKNSIRIAVMTLLFIIIIISTFVLTACNQQGGVINFVVDGQIYTSVTTKGNEQITLPDTPTKANYKFVGWYYDENVWENPFNNDDYANASLDQTVNVYAYFEQADAKKYAINFVAQGAIIKVIYSAGNEIIDLPTAPEIEHSTFKGWFYDNGQWQVEFDGTNYQDVQLTYDVYLYAKYEPTLYKIFFVVDGHIIDTIYSSGYETLQLPDAPQRADHAFSGWYLDYNVWQIRLTPNMYINSPITENIFAYAVYRYTPPVPKYDVSFLVNDESIFTYESSGNEILSAPEAPVLEGYEFKGWYYDKDTWQKPYDEKDYMLVSIKNDINVYARYDKLYNVRFWVNDEVVSTVISSGNSLIELPSKPIVEGYTFRGWYLDKDVWTEVFDGYNFNETILTQDIDIYAQMIPEDVPIPVFDIRFWVNGENFYTTSSSGLENIYLPQAPTINNYDFKGWFLDKDTWKQKFDGTNFANVTLTQNVDVYAFYAQKYTITFWAEDKVVSTVVSSGYENISPPNAPSKTDYNFVGWFFDKGMWSKKFTNDYFANSFLTSNINLYAYYERITYTVTFVTNGGTDIKPMEVWVINSSPVTTRPGAYEFEGWFLDEQFTKRVEFPFYPTSDVTLYAMWWYVIDGPTTNTASLIGQADNITNLSVQASLSTMIATQNSNNIDVIALGETNQSLVINNNQKYYLQNNDLTTTKRLRQNIVTIVNKHS